MYIWNRRIFYIGRYLKAATGETTLTSHLLLQNGGDGGEAERTDVTVDVELERLFGASQFVAGERRVIDGDALAHLYGVRGAQLTG